MKHILKYILLLPVSIAAKLAAYPLAPIAAFTADGNGRTIRLLAWMETQDNLGWAAIHEEPVVTKIADRFGRRVALAYWFMRNKAYAFHKWIGVKLDASDVTMAYGGDSVPPKWGFSHYWITLRTGGRSYFTYEPKISLGGFYLFFRLGWKLRGYLGNRIPPNDSPSGMFVGISIRSDDWDG